MPDTKPDYPIRAQLSGATIRLSCTCGHVIHIKRIRPGYWHYTCPWCCKSRALGVAVYDFTHGPIILAPQDLAIPSQPDEVTIEAERGDNPRDPDEAMPLAERDPKPWYAGRAVTKHVKQ